MKGKEIIRIMAILNLLYRLCNTTYTNVLTLKLYLQLGNSMHRHLNRIIAFQLNRRI